MNFLVRILELIQTPVKTPPRKQLVMRTGFAKLAVMKHHYPITFLDRGKAMGDDKRCAFAHNAVDGLLDKLLGLGVYRACSLVQYQDRGIEGHRASERNELFLTHR